MRIPFLRPKSEAVDEATPPKRKSRAAPAVTLDDPAGVQQARTQARRRLVGALVLLLIGVVGFPILFETQPRPLPMDTPIEAPRRETVAGGPVLKEVTPTRAPPAAVLPPDPSPAELASAPVPVPASAPAPVPAPVSAPIAPAASVAATVPAAVAASATAERYVVQAGAYKDVPKLREARSKIEGLGLKTYTQVVESDTGTRTRVRVGPFGTRAEAEAVAAKIKRSGLPAVIIAL